MTNSSNPKLKDSRMKKNRFTSALLALTLITTAAPIAAKESAVKKRFDASLKRLKRCIKGKCTTWEGIKAARDLGITAALVITAVYAIRKRAVIGEFGAKAQAPARRIGAELYKSAKSRASEAYQKARERFGDDGN